MKRGGGVLQRVWSGVSIYAQPRMAAHATSWVTEAMPRGIPGEMESPTAMQSIPPAWSTTAAAHPSS